MPPSRRTLLQASALGLAASVAGCAGVSENRQETETTAEGEGGTTTARGPDETIVLGGETSHWFGLAPSPIHEAENPTLGLQPGTVYEIVWVNLDGVEHELRVFDADDDVVAASESAEEVGETRSVVLEATESLARYDCEYHPQSMRGQITQEATITTGGTATETTTAGDDGGGPY
ncbi:hypothetical protein [Halorussus salinisoli]|uniref:hypothetical protein n=1 Tax=Halorussus salinisoli TaxID=2558242 RepID=UPI0010C15BFA|nr:hypothetical protein [Halorussus salinisoli]